MAVQQPAVVNFDYYLVFMQVDGVEHRSNDFLFLDLIGDVEFSRKLVSRAHRFTHDRAEPFANFIGVSNESYANELRHHRL